MKAPTLAQVKAFALAQFLPLGLVFVTIFGILVPWPGAWLEKNTPLNLFSIVGIFFISGLQLQTSEIKKALKAWIAVSFSYLSILVLSPCLSLWVATWDLGPREFSDGLALFMAMPTTVSSGVLMTTEAGGNTALAVMLSAGTNLIGVGTAPLFLAAFLSVGSGGKKAFNIVDLLVKLLLAILLPLLVGKALRRFTVVTEWVKNHKLLLKLTSTLLLISVPWMAMSSGSDLIRAAPIGSVFSLLALGVILHAMLLAFNYFSCVALNKAGAKMPPSEIKAVLIGSSQKTVNTAVSVINFLPISVGDKGLLTLPCVLAHLMQILMDAFLVGQLKKFKDPGDGGSTPGAAGSGADTATGAGAAAGRAGAGTAGAALGLASQDGTAAVSVDGFDSRPLDAGPESGWDSGSAGSYGGLSLGSSTAAGGAGLVLPAQAAAGASASLSDGPHRGPVAGKGTAPSAAVPGSSQGSGSAGSARPTQGAAGSAAGPASGSSSGSATATLHAAELELHLASLPPQMRLPQEVAAPLAFTTTTTTATASASGSSAGTSVR